MSSRNLGQWVVCAALAGVYPASAGEEIETSFTYQGQLKENGVPANGTFDLRFDLLLDNGVQIARTCVFDVAIVNGLFTVELGFGAAVFDGRPLHLRVAVARNAIIPQINDCSPNTADPFTPIGPPQAITSAPYCLRALSAENGHALDASDGTPTNALFVGPTGNVGIGTTTPFHNLTIANGGASIFDGVNQGVFITTDSFHVNRAFNEDPGYEYDGANDVHHFYNGGSQSMTISASGSVGIGTASPEARLHVLGGTSGTGVILPGLRVLQNTTSPNVVGGSSANAVDAGVVGATIGGGGAGFDENHIRDHYGTIAGGKRNTIETVGLAGSEYATIGGGFGNEAIGECSVIPGGCQNQAGGTFSLAAGQRAKVRDQFQAGDNNGDKGTFVWADSTDADFTSTGDNQFLIRAGGGVGINKNNPVAGALDVAGSGLFSGNVGIGITAPLNRLHVSGGASAATPMNTAELIVEDDSTTYINLISPDSSERGLSFGSPAHNFHGGVYYNNSTGMNFRTGVNNTQMTISSDGNVGIGTTTPALPLHVSNGASGGTLLATAEIVVEDDASSYVQLMSPAASERGIAFGSPASALHGGIYYTDAGGMTLRTGIHSTRMLIENNGDVGIGTTGLGDSSVDGKVHVASSNDRVAKFDRYGSDGELVAFARDDALVGNISVVAGLVTYNAFTGSHFGWSSAPIEPGALVSMTGQNRRFGDRIDAEVVYGIRTTATPNDSACLGVFIGAMEPTKELGPHNPLLVAAVGNGDLCVVERGAGDIKPGDYLVSSDVPGCAMKDDPSLFPVGHIIARAAEPVCWLEARASASTQDRKTISVLFGNFVRQMDEQRLTKMLEEQKRTIDSLRDQLSQVEHRLGQLQLTKNTNGGQEAEKTPRTQTSAQVEKPGNGF